MMYIFKRVNKRICENIDIIYYAWCNKQNNKDKFQSRLNQRNFFLKSRTDEKINRPVPEDKKVKSVDWPDIKYL